MSTLNPNITKTVLANLALNENYMRKVLPFLKSEYFQNREDRILFDLTAAFIHKYNAMPTKEALVIDLGQLPRISDQEYKAVHERIKHLAIEKGNDPHWLLDQTEKFCSEAAVTNAIMQGIEIIQGKDSNRTMAALPKLLQDALAVSFDPHVGHDFKKDWEARFEHYKNVEEKLPTGLEIFDQITRGGWPKGSLSVFMAAPYVGKTLLLCHFAASALKRGKNVLYITLEMGEIGDPSISQRIDANLLGIPVTEDYLKMSKEFFRQKVETHLAHIPGNLIVKGYPTATAGVSSFRFLLNELRLKKDFIPNLICVDYLNICVSSRLKMGSNVGSYTYVKSIAEELRGLAQEFEVPLLTATQLNREGAKKSDPTMENAAESYGLPMTADFLLSIVTNEALDTLQQFELTQLKNRYGSPKPRKFCIGVKKSLMQLYDLEDGAVVVEDDSPLDKAKEELKSSMREGRKIAKHMHCT